MGNEGEGSDNAKRAEDVWQGKVVVSQRRGTRLGVVERVERTHLGLVVIVGDKQISVDEVELA